MTPKKTIMARLRRKRKSAAGCYMCGEPASEGMSSCGPCREVIRIKQPWKQVGGGKKEKIVNDHRTRTAPDSVRLLPSL